MQENIFYLSLIDSIKDCIEILPFLIVIFFIIEIIEYFYSDKISSFSKFSKKLGPLLGTVLASIPQCGLSVVASTLYCKRMLTRGTLIGVYLATSDEAIPVLFSQPSGVKVLVPLIGIKIFTGVLAGYLIDLIFPSSVDIQENAEIKIEKGCHSHSISKENKFEVFIHPVIHTLSVLLFIFVVTFIINILMSGIMPEGADFSVLQNRFIQPPLTALAGLIPNCAISVGITILYLKGILSFASCVSGLCASAGLGLLVLIKNNESKCDTLKIILLLLGISVLAGFICALF